MKIKFKKENKEREIEEGISIRWAAQPKSLYNLINGYLVLRKRDKNCTIAITGIAVGGKYGLISINKANEFGDKLIKLIEDHQ